MNTKRGASGPPGMTGVVVERNVEAKMRDGAVLRADLYRPAGDGRYPVLVQRTPYNKQLLAIAALTLDPIRAADAGYVVAIQDIRARWASEGETFMFHLDGVDDGHDTVEWAAQLPFSDGRVGLYGISFTGRAAWLAASAAPPSLGAVAAATAPNDLFPHLYRGGALQWGLLVYWALNAIAPSALVRAKGGSAEFMPSLLGLVDDIDGFESSVRHLPLRTFPGADPSLLAFFFDVLEHPSDDEYWRARSVVHRSIRAPALIVAGWHDLLLGDDLSHFASMRSGAATAEARQHTRIVIGPWSHGTFHHVVGEVDHGFRSNGLFLDLREDLTRLHMRWFDRRLKGVDNGIDTQPPVRIFVQGVNRWRDEDDWPLARAADTRWFLGAGGRLGPRPPGPGDEPSRFTYDPADPCPTRGGTILLPQTYRAGPVDQGPLLTRRDVLVFTSEPVERDLEVTGPVHAVLYASTSARDTDWVVKLCDVRSDGRTLNVCDGVLRARYRRSLEFPTLVEPGAVERYEIDLWATSMVFAAGHRLRVLVTSSDFPRYDRNLNTAELGAESSHIQTASQTIFHDAERASHVLLPVVGG